MINQPVKKTLLILTSLIFTLQLSSQSQVLQKIGIKDSLHSKILNEYRDIYIQFPASYKANSDKKYPTVYILDGRVLLPAVNTVYEFYYGGYLPEMILIGISNNRNRTRDLTPTKITTKYGMPFHEPNGEAATFLRFIEEELITYIEDKYPVTNYRTLIGHSYGGLFTINTLMNNPELFANYLAIDPTLYWDDQKLLKQIEDTLKQISFDNKSLFVTLSGQLHMQNSEITIDNVMEDTSDYTLFARSIIQLTNLVNNNSESGLQYDWKFYPKDLHGTVPLPSILDGLKSLFQWYEMEHMDQFNDPETPTNALLDIVQYRYKKLKDHFGYTVPPYPEDLFNGLGYMYMQMGQKEKSKMFFELGIEYYPKSANVYDSMAAFYENEKDFKTALELVKKAYALDNSDYYKKRIETLGTKN